ncbi:Phytochrome-like protein cph1 [Bremerella volcania]|uniref:histidine kinase n=1 Tax=Bremerella volcania TaxID=2527984 RepID=A0A518C3A9_9BACT|nr:ATP-binding protein [Bremerella volcania]QDU73674.1 Phytochrome-like protein cph1 [Bremerella volcania]
MTNPESPSKKPEVDLTNCDREPIHLAGAVQPHGALLAFELAGLSLKHVSQNADQWFKTIPEIGTTVSKLFDEASCKLLQMVATGLRNVVRPIKLRPRVGNSIGLFSAAAHVYQGTLIVELERSAADGDLTANLGELSLPLQLTRANQRLQQSNDLKQLYQVIAEEMRDISGFDRVMLYRFADDNHGEVIGESVVEGKGSFLGLHYPATDIPEQARRLYVLNTVRSIGDVNAEAVPILPGCHADAKRPLDLSLSCFRAVSPVHLEYLQNMGVQASMSISIVIDNRLWGLIACHHYTAKPLRLEERAACEIMGLVIGNYLSAREQSEVNHERSRRRRNFHNVLDLITQNTGVWRSLDAIWSELRQIVDSNGLAVVSERTVQLLGSTPRTGTVQAIVRNLESTQGEGTGIWDTHCLADSIPGYPLEQESSVCGCLAVPLSAPEVKWLLFFRDEFVSEVTWAGNPDKSAVPSEDGFRLSPRKSFEQWKTTVHRQSKRWTLVDREMAEELRSGLVELLSLRAAELVRLNEELASINADLDSFAYAASHDLREPLRGIKQTAFLLRRELGVELNEATEGRLATLSKLASRMDELIQGLLRLSRAGQGNLEYERVDLKEVVDEALEMVVGRPTPSGIEVVIDGDAILWADYLCIRELFTNLIANGIKYNQNNLKHLRIGVWQDRGSGHENHAVLYVRDNGIGIAADNLKEVFQVFRRLHLPEEYGGGSGAGLTICQKIVTRHGGKIWIESEPGLGSTIFFTLEQVG